MTKYTKTFADAMKEVRKPKVVKEDYEVSMAIGQLKTIQDRIGKIMEFLSGKSDDYNMEAWLQSKITSAEDKLNSVANYVTNNPEVNEAKEEPKGTDTKIGPAGKLALAKEKDTDALEAQLVTAKGQIELLKTKLENEKNKAVKPEPNKETGEEILQFRKAWERNDNGCLDLIMKQWDDHEVDNLTEDIDVDELNNENTLSEEITTHENE